MNKKILIIVIVLILVVVGIFFGYAKFGEKNSKNPSSNIENSKNQKDSSITGTIKDFLSKNLTQKCTITYPENKGTGTIYFSGNKFNNEFTVDVEGQEITGHSLSDGTYVYSWTDSTPMGFKIKIADLGKPTTDSRQQVDLNEEVSLNCAAWTLDQTKFTPPSNIDFQDFSDMIPQVNSEEAVKNEEQKAGNNICNMITDPKAKTECLNAIQKSGQ